MTICVCIRKLPFFIGPSILTFRPWSLVRWRGWGLSPLLSGDQCSRFPKLTDWVQHSLKGASSQRKCRVCLNNVFSVAKKHAPVVSSAFSVPAALGAPPPDASFSPQPMPAQDVEGSASSAPDNLPDLGIDRRLVLPFLDRYPRWEGEVSTFSLTLFG